MKFSALFFAIIIASAVSLFAGTSPASPKLDSVYIKIVDCYVPPAAYTRYSAPNLTYLMVAGDTSDRSDVVAKACNEVNLSYSPETTLKNQLGQRIADNFNKAEADQIFAACSAGAGFTDRALYERFNAFMKSFQSAFERESDIVWLRYVGRVLGKLADYAEAIPLKVETPSDSVEPGK